MKSPLVNERGWNMNSNDMLLCLNLKCLPFRAMPERSINGVQVYVKAQGPKEGPKGNRSRKHRVIAVCPECGRHVPFGRLGQHYKVH